MKKTFDINKVNIQSNPILYNNRMGDYFKVLDDKLSAIKYMQNQNGVEDKIKTLLRIPEFTNESQFWQGVAELLVWFYFESKEHSYSIEVGEQKNCDVSIVLDGISVNIEIKCPNPKFENDNEKKIACKYLHRTAQPFSEVQAVMNEIKAHIEMGLENQGDKAQYDKVFVELPDDNPLFQAIADAHSQLPELDDKTINIIFIPTTRKQMESFWAALINSPTGIFAIPNPLMRGNGNNPWTLSSDTVKNISAIILSDAIEMNARYNSESWSLNKCFNLVLSNTNSAYYKIYASEAKYQNILNTIICNQTKQFCEVLVQSVKRWEQSISQEWEQLCRQHIDTDPSFKTYSKEIREYAVKELMKRFQPTISQEALFMAHESVFMDYCSLHLKK